VPAAFPRSCALLGLVALLLVFIILDDNGGDDA
jgi:hypothetical protein